MRGQILLHLLLVLRYHKPIPLLQRLQISRKSVLIVDDNPTNLKLAVYVLASSGLDVRAVVDAPAALAAIDERVPDLILMDLQLPGMDGFELTRQLKSQPDFSHVKILAVTAFAMKGDEERALAAGCDGYVAKPINTRTLPGLVAHYLAGDA